MYTIGLHSKAWVCISKAVFYGNWYIGHLCLPSCITKSHNAEPGIFQVSQVNTKVVDVHSYCINRYVYGWVTKAYFCTARCCKKKINIPISSKKSCRLIIEYMCALLYVSQTLGCCVCQFYFLLWYKTCNTQLTTSHHKTKQILCHSLLFGMSLRQNMYCV